MENILTEHFRIIDYYKDMLFNAKTDEEEQRYRRMIERRKNCERMMYIQKELADHESN